VSISFTGIMKIITSCNVFKNNFLYIFLYSCISLLYAAVKRVKSNVETFIGDYIVIK
jgi:hypothetical protein